MPEDASLSEFLTLTQAAKLIPGRPSVSTVWRWALRGIGGVRLEHRRFGARLFTRRDWLDDFGRVLAEKQLNRFEQQPPPNPRGRTAKQRQRDLDEAKRTLADGI